MNDATSTTATDAVVTPLAGLVPVEQPLTRRGVVTVKVTVEATTLADGIPSAEQVAAALAQLGVNQSVYVATDRYSYGSGTRVTVTGIELA